MNEVTESTEVVNAIVVELGEIMQHDQIGNVRDFACHLMHKLLDDINEAQAEHGIVDSCMAWDMEIDVEMTLDAQEFFLFQMIKGKLSEKSEAQ